MNSLIERAMEKYGSTAAVTHGGAAAETKAFVQPVAGNSKYAPSDMTELGAADERLWRWIGRSDAALDAGDTVVCAGINFFVLRAEKVYVGDRAEFTRALLRAVSEASE